MWYKVYWKRDEVVEKYSKDSKRLLQLGQKITIIIDERETQKIKINKWKIRKEKDKGEGKEAIAKGWEINDFVEHLSFSN